MKAFASALAMFAGSIGARAEDPPCPPVAELGILVRCAQQSSEAVIRARAELDAARARRDIAGRVLPANPTLELGGGRRRTEAGTTDFDRSVELAQQIEIGGQRGARIDSADAELRAALAAADAVGRLIAADVLSAAVGVVRSRRALILVREQREAADRLVGVSRARSQKGVGAPFESELAEAARVQSLRDERVAAQELSEAEGQLAALVGTDVQLAPEAPLPVSTELGALADLENAAVANQPDVVAARSEVEAARARASLLRRERIPDLTLAAGFKHEELSDVIGVRLGVPLPLFRRNQGEIAEQEARGSQASARARHAELRVRLAARAAYRSWQRARAAAEAIPPDLEERLRGDVEALRQAYERGTLQLPLVLTSLREVQSARRTVLDAQAEAVLASIELARAAGLSPCPAGGCR